MKGILFLLCFLIIQINGQRILKNVKNSRDCAPGICCINDSNQTLAVGEKAADVNGLCQAYLCNEDNTYTVMQCPQWTDIDCVLAPGKTNALFPECCQTPAKESLHCHATIAMQ